MMQSSNPIPSILCYSTSTLVFLKQGRERKVCEQSQSQVSNQWRKREQNLTILSSKEVGLQTDASSRSYRFMTS